jgi:hypothetical protein
MTSGTVDAAHHWPRRASLSTIASVDAIVDMLLDGDIV